MFEKKINHFKANVEIMLAKKGENQAWLSRTIGMTQQSLRGILNHGRPTPKTQRKFIDALECELSDLTKDVTYEEYGKYRIPRN